MAKYRSNTGGTKEFSHPGFNLDDTDSSKEFKRSLLLKYFYDEPFDMTNIVKLKEYGIKFYKLKINSKNKFKVRIKNKTKEFLNEETNDNYEIELPKEIYKITIEKKTFLIFRKSKTINVDLDKNKEINLNL